MGKDVIFVTEKETAMDWQTILEIVITALLLIVWLPALILSMRKVQREAREKDKNDKTTIK